MVRLIEPSKSQDINEISDHTAQSEAASSGDEESTQTSRMASKRAIPGKKGAIINAKKRVHDGIWIEPSVKECDLDCRPTDEQLHFANDIGWGDSPVSEKDEKKMFRLLPKEVKETEETEVKGKTTIRKRKAMSVPAPISADETPESTDRRSQRVRRKVNTYNDRALARRAVSSREEDQSDSDASKNTARQHKLSPKKPQEMMENSVSSPARSEAESSDREPGTVKRRSQRARPTVKTYNTKIMAGTAVHTPANTATKSGIWTTSKKEKGSKFSVPSQHQVQSLRMLGYENIRKYWKLMVLHNVIGLYYPGCYYPRNLSLSCILIKVRRGEVG
ncbi:hypothetical protein BHYA_0258g00080 [Botrytis hyacinthi]|uniref:Uncharacterized protein n=1 Tax=Botrytis hyacinthi TaxID=278943 RepID=A0A4Z1GCP7_9HELO|nr:hypothetical protein BHYA_0258g00080 [Botrytis hyacinthi]